MGKKKSVCFLLRVSSKSVDSHISHSRRNVLLHPLQIFVLGGVTQQMEASLFQTGTEEGARDPTNLFMEEFLGAAGIRLGPSHLHPLWNTNTHTEMEKLPKAQWSSPSPGKCSLPPPNGQADFADSRLSNGVTTFDQRLRLHRVIQTERTDFISFSLRQFWSIWSPRQEERSEWLPQGGAQTS